MVRETRETHVEVEVNLDGEGRFEVDVEPAFLKHMLETLAKHGLLDLKLKASGDLAHHVVEDTALTLGEAFDKAAATQPTQIGGSAINVLATPMLVCWRANKDNETPRNGPEKAPPIIPQNAFGFVTTLLMVFLNSC